MIAFQAPLSNYESQSLTQTLIYPDFIYFPLVPVKYVRSDRVGLAWKEAKNIKIRKSDCRKDECVRAGCIRA